MRLQEIAPDFGGIEIRIIGIHLKRKNPIAPIERIGF